MAESIILCSDTQILDQMTTTTLTVDGAVHHLKIWASEDARAGILIIHGHGEHSGRYGHLASAFNEAGIESWAMDLYGHGQTEGKRGHVPRYDLFWDSIDATLSSMREKLGDKPLFLFGHSMGGNIVASYTMKRQPKLQGILLSGAYFRLAFTPTTSQLLLARVGKLLMPSLTQPSKLDVKGLSRDAEEVKMYVADPLIHEMISPALFSGITENGDYILNNAKDWKHPVIIAHGSDDPVTSFEASKDLFDGIPEGVDKTWKPMPGSVHEMHNDLDREEIIHTYRDWMVERIK
ncbi:MAG: lysophospholipase [Bacteroidota bacterium]